MRHLLTHHPRDPKRVMLFDWSGSRLRPALIDLPNYILLGFWVIWLALAAYTHHLLDICTLRCRSGKDNECVLLSCCMDPPRSVKHREKEKREQDKDEEKEKDKEEEQEQGRERGRREIRKREQFKKENKMKSNKGR